MAAAATAQAQLLQLLSQLRPESNPYQAIQDALRDQLFPSVPYSATCQLYFLAAALALCVCRCPTAHTVSADLTNHRTAMLVAVSLALRWRRGGFWIMRWHQQPRMIHPHGSISWSIIAFVMLVCTFVL